MLTFTDREEALRDDPYFSNNYTYDDDDDEWDEDEKWEGEEEEAAVEEEAPEAKEESNAYLEFLHDEVRPAKRTLPAATVMLTCPGSKV